MNKLTRYKEAVIRKEYEEYDLNQAKREYIASESIYYEKKIHFYMACMLIRRQIKWSN